MMNNVVLVVADGEINTKLVSDDPLFTHALNSAKYSNASDVLISSDSLYVRKFAAGMGVNVFVPKTGTKNLDELVSQFSKECEFDSLTIVNARYPLLSPDIINDAMQKIHVSKTDLLFTVHKERWYPRWTTAGESLNFDLGNKTTLTEYNSRCYVENGMLYVTKSTEPLFEQSFDIIEINPYLCIEINHVNDIPFAETMI